MGKRIRPEIIYLDTSALIALFNSRDKNHQAAVAFLEDSLKMGAVFLLSRPVLVEYLNGLAKRVGKDVTREQYEAITSSRFIYMENETEKDWSRAWELFLSTGTAKG
ncbi:PIN domain-containing protein [Thermococcus aciditolerans]|uniref:PIN domain-containing protein n=1 Tax=Thermococcus aciditolerans TaxID=2598455 RepID=UPI00319DF37D